MFALGQNYKVENNDVMQLLVKLLLNSLYGEIIPENIDENFDCKSEYWMMSENDERVKDHWRISHGNFIVKMIEDKGLEDEVKKYKTIPLHLGAFVLSNSKRLLKNSISS